MKDIIKAPDIVSEARQTRSILKLKKPGINIIADIIFFGFLIIVSQVAASFLGLAPVMLLDKLMHPQIELGTFSTVNFEQAAYLVTTLPVMIIFIIYSKIFQRRSLRSMGFVKEHAVRNYLIGAVIGFAAFGAALLICKIAGAVEVTSNPERYSVKWILMFLLLWLIQGMEEEIMCRGVLLVSISRRYPLWIAIIANSLVFACLHLGNPGIGILAFINLLLFGILMSLIFIKTGNIWIVAAFHAIWNFVQGNFFGILVSGGSSGDSFLRTAFTEGKDLINGGSFGLEGGLGVTIMLAVFIGILLFCPGIRVDFQTTKSDL